MIEPKIFQREKDIPKGAKKLDLFRDELQELFFIESPKIRKGSPEAEKKLKDFLQKSHPEIWIYYPWKNLAVRSLPEDLYFKMRTARNHQLITEQEQIKYREAKIGIAGLSVGSNAALALVSSGGPKVLKIADPDVLEVSNLNRLAANLPEVGRNKAEIIAEKIWELDPVAIIDIWKQGLNENTVEEFITQPRLNIFIEQMDNIFLKFLTRSVCREQKIPVLMATDYGDGVILDVERFDQEPQRPLFHGRVGSIKTKKDILKLKNINRQRWLKLADEIIGPENHSPRILESIREIGKTLTAMPQLGTSAMLAGSLLAVAARKISVGENMSSGRYKVDFDEILQSQ